jgi:hypothetical protein
MSDSMTPIGTLDDGKQIWKITHNGVDTHPVHFHLFNVQLLNRVAWDGALLPPDPNELGWKETVRVNPLEDTIVAMRPVAPTQPFDIPNSVRLIDPTMPYGTVLMGPPGGFVDPDATPVTVINHEVNYGWEYVWHCHILSHEEMDMMHSMSFAVSPKAPSSLAATPFNNPQRIDLTWIDNSLNETGFTIERASDPAFTTDLATFTVGQDVITYSDTAVNNFQTYYYRVRATNLVGDTTVYPAPAVGFPSKTMNSTWSNAASILVTADLIVDNADGPASVSIVGSWITSTLTSGYQGTNYLHDGNTGKGTKSVTFTPNLPSNGMYQVYIRYTALSNRATAVPVDIVSFDGTNTATVNQRLNGGQWVSLGSHAFTAGTSGFVRVRTTGTTDGYVIADAVRFVQLSNTLPVIVDNASGPASVSIAGTWTASTAAAGYFGTNYLHDGNAGKGTKSVTFTPSLPSGGQYQVYLRYTADPNRATVVPVDITSTTGTSTVNVNQRINGSQWYSLGTYSFTAGTSGSVRVRTTGATDGYVIADAVRFVQVSAIAPVFVDNADGPTSVSIVGAWTTSTIAPGFWGTNYLHDGNVGKGTKSVTFTPNLLSGGQYQVYIRHTAEPNRATAVPVDVVSNAGTSTVNVNQRLNNNQWVSLGTYAFNTGTAGSVQIRTTGTTDGYVIADAAQFVYVGP